MRAGFIWIATSAVVALLAAVRVESVDLTLLGQLLLAVVVSIGHVLSTPSKPWSLSSSSTLGSSPASAHRWFLNHVAVVVAPGWENLPVLDPNRGRHLEVAA